MKRNKKIIIGGLSVLTAVALTSVGFATWVIGVQNKTVDSNVELLIDDVKNDTLFLDAELSYTMEDDVKVYNKLKVAENEAYDESKAKPTDIVKPEASTDPNAVITVSEDALTFSFHHLTISVGNNVDISAYKLKLSLVEVLNGNPLSGSTLLDETIASFDHTQSPYLSYSVEYPLQSKVSDENFTYTAADGATGTLDSYELNHLSQTLSWGEFFHYQEVDDAGEPVDAYLPSGYYNSQTESKVVPSNYEGNSYLSDLSIYSDLAYREILQMTEALTLQNSITIKAELVAA